MIRALGTSLAAAGVCTAVALSSAGAPASGIVFSADRGPQLSGEIYRIDLDGHRVDLSRSPAMDTAPVVSPDGKRVAFSSNRSGHWAVYVVGMDGRGLTRVSPALPQDPVWSPDSRGLAVTSIETTSHGTDVSFLYVLEPGRRPVVVRMVGDIGNPAWSPDGRLVAFSVSSNGVPSKVRSEIRAVTPAGRLAWRLRRQGVFTWGAGHLAVQYGGEVRLYDERGRLVARFAGRAGSVWSPNTEWLAVTTANDLKVRTSRGRLVFEKTLPGIAPELVWVSKTRIVTDAAPPNGFDISTGKRWRAGYGYFAAGLLSPDRTLVAETPPLRGHFALRVSKPDGSEVRTLARVPGCANRNSFDNTISDLQFTPDSRSLVYQSDCPQPYSNLYIASPGTGVVRRLTWASELELDPQLSPDGKNIVFAQAVVCDSCQTGLWLAKADGSHRRQLVPALSCGDSNPSWSPDGRQIVFWVLGCDNPEYQLYTVRANGSRLRNLYVPGQEPAWGPRRIAYIGPDGSAIDTIAPDGSRKRTVATGRANTLSYPAWSRDGRLAYLDQAGGRFTIVIRAGSSTRRIRLPFARVAGLAWAPDGHSLAVTGSAHSVTPRDLYTIGADGRHLTRLTHNMNVGGVSWR